ncbi:MAG: 30S ribosomal protein S1 [Candidatus Latescibacteria bacterium]|nr:30S ribosomal protein S1 [Candidatus Latescibacterota bacterium]
MADDTVKNNESPVEVSEPTETNGELGEETLQEIIGDSKPGESLRSRLTRKATRFLDESDYSEDEYSSMLDMYDKTMKSFELGKITDGIILKITDDSVIVDIGFKSEGIINLSEFGSDPDIKVDDKIEVFLDDFENQDGQMVLSKQKADFMRVWDRIKDIYDSNEEVEGQMIRRIKGGIVVNILGVDGFLPGSQIDIRQVRDFDQYIGQSAILKIIKLNKIRRNIVVSRRAVLEEERSKLRETVLEELEIDQVREGTVKNITDFGAFIDLGGVDGLLHITDMSWGRIGHPSALVSIGDKIDVKVLNFEEGKTRISLGMKQLSPYPWEGVDERYPEDSVVDGNVVSTTDYGVFVGLEHGIEGLVHISEMSWTHPPRHPSKMFKVGDTIQCKILNVDKEGEKISLGIKQLEPDPWATIDERHPIGSRVEGKVRNLTNFGAFVEIEDGIDGLVHISDMSWTKRIKHPSEVMKKAEAVEVMILDINKAHRRISLGHKQLYNDPWETLKDKCSVGTITNGVIIRILDRGVVVSLENDIEGFVPAFQLGQAIKKPADNFNVGDEIPLKVIEFEKEQRKIILSVREYFKDRDKDELEEFKEKYKPKKLTIGDAVGDILEGPAEGDAPPGKPEEAVDVESSEEAVTAEKPDEPEKASKAPVEKKSEDVSVADDETVKAESASQVEEDTPVAEEEKTEAAPSETLLQEEQAETAIEAPPEEETEVTKPEEAVKEETVSEESSESIDEKKAESEEIPEDEQKAAKRLTKKTPDDNVDSASEIESLEEAKES